MRPAIMSLDSPGAISTSSTGNATLLGAQDQAIEQEVGIAQRDMAAVAYRVEVGAVRSIGGERVVMPVKQNDGFGKYQRLHGQRIPGSDRDGDETLPASPGIGRAWPRRLQPRSRQVNHTLHR